MAHVDFVTMGIHERCALSDDRRHPTDSGPMTRRQARLRVRASHSRNPGRRAWWCLRCGAKVTAKDKVAFVAPRS